MNTYELGAKSTLTGVFTDIDGMAMSPDTITVRVRRPSGGVDTYTGGDINVPEVGSAEIEITLDEVGFWFYRFEGTGNVVVPDESSLYVRESAFDTAATDGGPYFGATIDGVKDKLPDRTFTDTTKPTEAAVGRFIIEISGRVSARLGAIDTISDDARRASVLEAARSLVHLGAASWAEAAGAPEEAEADNASTYATWLWTRFSEGLDELTQTAYNLVPPDPVDNPETAAGSPVWSFPNTPAYGMATSHFERY